MKLCFDSIEEVKLFVGSLKGTRGKGKGDEGDEGGQTTTANQAPAPIMPPQGQQQPFQPAAFAPPANPFPQQPVGDSVVMGLVQRIVAKIDSAIASGQPADRALDWFRGQCGAEASVATLDQIKTVFLPKLTVVGLEQIAKLMGA